MQLSNNKLSTLPLKISLGFLIITEILVWVGPIDFGIKNNLELVFFLLIVNLSFFIGYKRGVLRFRPSVFKLSNNWIFLFIILGCVLTYFHMMETWSRRGLGLNIETLIFALISSGDVYFSDVTDEVAQTSRFMQLLSIIRWCVIPFGFYYWKRLPKLYKFLTLLTVVFEVLTSFGSGTRQGLFDIIIIILFCYLAGSYLFSENESSFALAKKRIKIGALILGGLFLVYFIASNLSRSGLGLSEIGSTSINGDIRSGYDWLPSGVLYAIVSPVGYLCQGYYALSLGLDIGVISPIPFSSNWFTAIWAEHHLGSEPLSQSYMARLEVFGIGTGQNWHTIYLWLANQYTFFLVPVIIYIIGYCFSHLWCEILYGKNPLAVPIFALFLIMVFYFYANNQVLSFSFLPFLGWGLLYIFSKLFSAK